VSGTVGIIANDNARYSLFAISLTQLSVPRNTTIDWSLTSDRIYGRNILTERMLDRGSEWLMFLDDDHVFPTNIVNRLLAHQVDIVGSLYLQRQHPFRPICYDTQADNGRYEYIDLTQFGPDDLVQVMALGTGGMLIRAEVFHKMPFPWFEHGVASEDLIFCRKAGELGFDVYCDLGVRLGHMTQTSIWPDHQDGQWNVGFAIADRFSLNVGIEPHTEEEQRLAEEPVGVTPQ